MIKCKNVVKVTALMCYAIIRLRNFAVWEPDKRDDRGVSVTLQIEADGVDAVGCAGRIRWNFQRDMGWVKENKGYRTDMFSGFPLDAWFHVMVSSSIVDGVAEEVLYCNRAISMVPLWLTLTSINYVVESVICSQGNVIDGRRLSPPDIVSHL